MKKIILCLLFGSYMVSAMPQEFMKVSGEKVLSEDKTQRCYKVRKGYSRKDKTPWETYCGEFSNFYYEGGYEYTMHVEKYDITADTIRVIKTIGRDNSDSYRKQQELKKRRAEAAAQAAAQAEAGSK